jgi:transposase InsO family protein
VGGLRLRARGIGRKYVKQSRTRVVNGCAEPLVLESSQQAIRSRQPRRDLIHHSDRGGQYAGHAYRALLRRAAIGEATM